MRQQHLSQTSEWQCATVSVDLLQLLCSVCMCVESERACVCLYLSFSFLFYSAMISDLCAHVCVSMCTWPSDRQADRVKAVAN